MPMTRKSLPLPPLRHSFMKLSEASWSTFTDPTQPMAVESSMTLRFLWRILLEPSIFAEYNLENFPVIYYDSLIFIDIHIIHSNQPRRQRSRRAFLNFQEAVSKVSHQGTEKLPWTLGCRDPSWPVLFRSIWRRRVLALEQQLVSVPSGND